MNSPREKADGGITQPRANVLAVLSTLNDPFSAASIIRDEARKVGRDCRHISIPIRQTKTDLTAPLLISYEF